MDPISDIPPITHNFIENIKKNKKNFKVLVILNVLISHLNYYYAVVGTLDFLHQTAPLSVDSIMST